MYLSINYKGVYQRGLRKNMDKKTDCSCELKDGQGVTCLRHGCQKSPHQAFLCANSPAYFAMYENGRGPCVKIDHTSKKQETCCPAQSEEPDEINSKPTEIKKPQEVKMPSLGRQVMSLGAAIVKEGVARVTLGSPQEDMASRRLKICEACPLLDKSSYRCKACGCAMRNKVHFRSATCPKNLWGQE